MGFFTCLVLGLICFGLVRSLLRIVCIAYRCFAPALFMAVGIGPHTCDSGKVKEVCCPLHSGESVQSGQVESHPTHYPFLCVHIICLPNSFTFLWGPWAHLLHLLSCDRLPFTLCYLATAIGTLYCALSVSHYCRSTDHSCVTHTHTHARTHVCTCTRTHIHTHTHTATQHCTNHTVGWSTDSGTGLVPYQLYSWRNHWTQVHGKTSLKTVHFNTFLCYRCLTSTTIHLSVSYMVNKYWS